MYDKCLLIKCKLCGRSSYIQEFTKDGVHIFNTKTGMVRRHICTFCFPASGGEKITQMTLEGLEVYFEIGITFPKDKNDPERIALKTEDGTEFTLGQVDFYLPDYRTIIEVDGKHHLEKEVMMRDKARDKYFQEKLDIKTVRILNLGDHDDMRILEAIENIIDKGKVKTKKVKTKKVKTNNNNNNNNNNKIFDSDEDDDDIDLNKSFSKMSL